MLDSTFYITNLFLVHMLKQEIALALLRCKFLNASLFIVFPEVWLIFPANNKITHDKDPSINTAQNSIPTKELPTINDCDCQTDKIQDKIINGK